MVIYRSFHKYNCLFLFYKVTNSIYDDQRNIYNVRQIQRRTCYRPTNFNLKVGVWENKNGSYATYREARLSSWVCNICDSPFAAFKELKYHKSESHSYWLIEWFDFVFLGELVCKSENISSGQSHTDSSSIGCLFWATNYQILGEFFSSMPQLPYLSLNRTRIFKSYRLIILYTWQSNRLIDSCMFWLIADCFDICLLSTWLLVWRIYFS